MRLRQFLKEVAATEIDSIMYLRSHGVFSSEMKCKVNACCHEMKLRCRLRNGIMKQTMAMQAQKMPKRDFSKI
eukprot:IDg965t1